MRKFGMRERVLVASCTLALGAAAPAGAEQLVGLSGANVVTFESASPGTIQSTKAITGLPGGETVVGLDYRAIDGGVYAYSSANKVYRLNLGGATAAATLTTTLTSATNGPSTNTPLSTFPPGGAVTIDFNPAANALRVLDTADNSYRLRFTDFALFNDGKTRLGAADFSQTVVAAGYTNNVFGAATTQLFVLDAVNNGLYLVNPPNDGNMTLVGTGLGVDVPASGVGFEITEAGSAFASINGSLYTINTGTGTATLVGTIGAAVTDLAQVPEPGTIGVLLVGAAGLLRRGQRAGRA